MADSSPLPAWLKRSLVAAGHMSAQGLTRRARIVRCPRCRVPTMAGYDASVAALDAWCDLTELSPLGEALALVDRRWTYTLHSAGDRDELDRRDQFAIAAPRGGRVVLCSHRCAEPVPAAWRAPVASGGHRQGVRTPSEYPDSPLPF